MRNSSIVLASITALGAGCANDPVYLPAPASVDAGETMDMDGNILPGVSALVIPVKHETAADAADRARRQVKLDAMAVIPYIAVDDLQIEVEWTITNLTAMPGHATVQLNGANQFFRYDPSMIMLSADPEEAPPPPGLDGDRPLDLLPNGSISGLFTEDNVREAAIDLDQITRGNVNPFRATLTVSKNIDQFAQLAPLTFDMNGDPLPQATTGVMFPREAIPAMLELDLVFKPDRHMKLEYTVRVRDIRGDLLPDKLMAAPMSELEPFAPADFSIMATATP
jgi:hypothetical protein